MKERKVGLTATNWILSILGMLVLSSFIILPPVFRTYMKEEVVEEEPKEEIKIGTTICRNENLVNSNYVDNVTLLFTHQNQKIQEFTRNTTRTYTDPLMYQEEKTIYGKYVTAFSIINGYEYGATPEDDTSSFQIHEKYDLAIFKPTTIMIPGDENPTAITTDYDFNTNITTIKDYLTTNGYTCSDSES